MNVQLLPEALKEIDVLRAAGYRGAGFLLGTTIGHFVLVERLLPLDFDPRRGKADAACAAVFAKYGEELQGAFFCRRPPAAMDWLVGDLVLAIRPGQIEALTCKFPSGRRGERGGRRARLVPLLENAEASWPI